jgi:large subunit ribosomal protein L3
MKLGDVVGADTFKEGDKVDVTGTSKGHGFTGPVKRHNGHIQKMSHGGGPVHRHAGSMGSTTDPSRIFKGHNGAGHWGVETVTVQNLDIVKVDAELNMIVVRGAIPGPKGGIVYLKNTVKNVKEKGAAAAVSVNPQKASGRNPQKASARKA